MITVKATRLALAALAIAALGACANQPANQSTGTTEAVQTTTPRSAVTVWQQDVGDRVFFALDRSDLTPESQATLRRQAEFLAQNPQFKLEIEGHADERGTREYNLALGERRANAVRNYLVAMGVEPARLETVSYGKERPAVLGQGEAVWQQNRRGVSLLK